MAAQKDIQTTLGYWDPYFESDKRPWTFTRPREKGEEDRYPCDQSEVEMIKSIVHDGRQHDLNLDQNGFQRVESITSLSTADFQNEEMLRKVYFKEVEAEMKRVTGAEDVIVWNHFIRFVTMIIIALFFLLILIFSLVITDCNLPGPIRYSCCVLLVVPKLDSSFSGMMAR